MNLLLLAFLEAGRASAQSAALQKAADGDAPKVFDGSVLRTEGPLDIVAEEKDALIKTETVPAHQECARLPGTMGDGMTGTPHYSTGYCWTEPEHTYETFGDKQTVRVNDRDRLVSEADGHGARNGAMIGGAIGLLGLLGLIGGPWGWALAAGTVIAGALIGAGIGSTIEKNKVDTHDIYERVVNERTVRADRPADPS